MAINELNNVNFKGEQQRQGSSGLGAGLLAGAAAGGISYAAWKSPMTSEQIVGLEKDTFEKMAKDAKLEDSTTNTVKTAMNEKAKIKDTVENALKEKFGDTDSVEENKILGKSAEDYKKGIDKLEEELDGVKNDKGEVTQKGLKDKLTELENKANAEGATEVEKTEAKKLAKEVNQKSAKLADKKAKYDLAKEGKIPKVGYEKYLTEKEEAKVLKPLEELGEKLKGLKARSGKKALIVAGITALVIGLLARTPSSDSHK